MTHPIRSITAEEIRDSRGTPTLRVRVATDAGEGMFDVPSGASTGVHEAHELRDDDGGVSKAIANINNTLAPALIGKAVDDQRLIDSTMRELDGTLELSRLGGNAIIGVSIAAAKAAAIARGVPTFEYLRTLAQPAPSRTVPYLIVNMFNGGAHAPGGTPFQEHQIIPKTDSVSDALEIVKKVRVALGDTLIGREKKLGEGDEGGYWCEVADVGEPFDILREALERAKLDDKVFIGADIAASSIERDGEKFQLIGESRKPEEMIALYQEFAQLFNLSHIEDPFGEEEFAHFAVLRAAMPQAIIIGDDLTTTNAERVREAGERGSINAVIIKPNQNGTLSGTIDAVVEARLKGMHCIASHRSGDTNDDFIADFAFAFGCYGLKAGAPHKAERAVKYERLATISHV